MTHDAITHVYTDQGLAMNVMLSSTLRAMGGRRGKNIRTRPPEGALWADDAVRLSQADRRRFGALVDQDEARVVFPRVEDLLTTYRLVTTADSPPSADVTDAITRVQRAIDALLTTLAATWPLLVDVYTTPVRVQAASHEDAPNRPPATSWDMGIDVRAFRSALTRVWWQIEQRRAPGKDGRPRSMVRQLVQALAAVFDSSNDEATAAKDRVEFVEAALAAIGLTMPRDIRADLRRTGLRVPRRRPTRESERLHRKKLGPPQG